MEPESVQTVRVEQAARILGIGRSSAWAAVRRGDMPGVIRIGGSVRISKPALEAMLRGEKCEVGK